MVFNCPRSIDKPGSIPSIWIEWIDDGNLSVRSMERVMGIDKFDGIEFTRYIPIARPSDHPASQDVQNLFHTILWSCVARPQGENQGWFSTAHVP